MSNNELKYTSLTVEDILAQVQGRFLTTTDGETNHKFDNFRESAIAQTLIEIFAGTVDINNYYIQRRAEECYFDTAQLKSSVISLSRMFGYVMNRKEPSHAKLRMVIKGDIKDNQVQIPYYSKFSFDGNPFVLVNTMTYRFSEKVYNAMNDESVITIDSDSFDNPIEVVQGTIKEKVFNGATNGQVNSPFQIYKIEDKSFSNVYGEKDFFYNDVTQVYVGENKITSDDPDENTRFSIDRRSLLNWETISTSNLSESKSVCVIRTSPDGFVELLFGDGTPNVSNTQEDQQATGGFARKGALTRKDNIYVQYLSCEGQSTNKVGVIGDKVDFSGKIFNSLGDDITSKVSFELLSSVYGGGDDESMDSIKYSSPKIYYSLDRLVTKDDYIAYMKSLNTPINVQNAVAWGEQEERDLAYKFALAKMFNVSLFTMTGSMYDLDAQPHGPKTCKQFEEVVLDLNYDPYEFQTQGYFNIFVVQEMVNQLKRYASLTTFNELKGLNFADNGVDAPPAVTQLSSIATNIKNNIVVNYGENVTSIPLTFEYTSDNIANSANLTTYGTVDVTGLATVMAMPPGEAFLVALGEAIDIALRGFKDIRGNKTDNKNFKKQAFYGRWKVDNAPDEVIMWETFDENNNNTGKSINGAIYEFRIRFNELEKVDELISPCYITKFSEDVDTFAGILGLNGSTVFPTTENAQSNEMNGKITKVVADLSSRSQTNVKNIYVSPIIHQFDVVGDVYVKSLYEKESVKNEITNELFEWLDVNADFNKPLYLSNIIEIFERHLGVIHANITLRPTDISRPDGKPWYNPNYDIRGDYNPVYEKYTTYDNSGSQGTTVASNDIAETIKAELDLYLAGPAPSERSFYLDFAGVLYSVFKGKDEKTSCPGSSYTCNDHPNYGLFIGLDKNISNSYRSDVIRDTTINSDFSTIMEQIHKDLSDDIRDNLLDSSSNIDTEYDLNNEYVRGGFSLGSEIVQILVDSFDDDAELPLLNFRYK